MGHTIPHNRPVRQNVSARRVLACGPLPRQCLPTPRRLQAKTQINRILWQVFLQQSRPPQVRSLQ